MIRLDHLSVRVGDFQLQDISFEVPSGGYGLLIGPSGSGKTTLLETVAGHVPPQSGRVHLHGEDVTSVAPERRGVGFVYQNYHLFPHLDVRDNIRYGLLRGSLPAPEQLERVRELAELLGIESLLGRSIHGLSGGETQRVALARALAPRPSILLLDEPFAAVDPATRHMLRRELRAIHAHERVTTLQVTHDFDEALRLGDVVAVMAEGRIAQLGRPDEVFRFPNSAFVAKFIGTGTVLRGEVTRQAPGTDTGPFAAWFESAPLRFEVVAEREGPAHAVLRPEDLLLSREPVPGSARNRFAAVVNRVERVGPVSYVHLDAGRPLTAAVTTASAGELGLAPGIEVVVSVKATAIHLV
jgi:molybdopterin-binding protein